MILEIIRVCISGQSVNKAIRSTTMTSPTTKPIIWLSLIALVLGTAAALAGLPAPVKAGSSLPPRETPVPPPADDDKDRDGPLVGAHLELAAPNAPAGAWVVVQWQDSAGGWHNVEGWQGTLGNSSRWWVHPKDFGTGPFRWMMMQAPNGPMIGMSEPFRLPDGANEVTKVVVAVQ
jgi:hypothetical protein